MVADRADHSVDLLDCDRGVCFLRHGEKAYSNFPPIKALLRDREIGGCVLSFPGDSRRASAFRNSEFRISEGAKSNHARNPSEDKPS